MSTVGKFKALGAGNGLTFPKAKTPTETRNRPTTALTLKECMAWYWLLKDINLELTLRNTHDTPTIETISTLDLTFDILAGHDEVIRNSDGAVRFYDGVPKERASLHPTEQLEMADGRFYHHNHQIDLETPQAGGAAGVNSNGFYTFELYMAVEWFENDTASVIILVDDGYHRFVLTNLPTTSDLFTTTLPLHPNMVGSFLIAGARLNLNTQKDPNEALTPASIGIISTPYGDLDAYDVSMDTNTSTNQVTAVSGTVQFYDFDS